MNADDNMEANDKSSENQVPEMKYDNLQEGSFHEEFKEAEEVRGIIANLSNIYEDMILVEMAVEKFLCK